MGVVKITGEMARQAVEETDWARVDAKSDDELTAAAQADPDNPPLTDDQLDRLEVSARVKQLRRQLGLSQSKFAHEFRIPVGNVRDWEQGRVRPDASALAYLHVIEREPEAVKRALAEMAPLS